jgi:hypothetical protein
MVIPIMKLVGRVPALASFRAPGETHGANLELCNSSNTMKNRAVQKRPFFQILGYTVEAEARDPALEYLRCAFQSLKGK